MISFKKGFALLLLLMGLFVSSFQKEEVQNFPNIVVILVDDLGYGDLKSFNPKSLIPTPNLDLLASEGIRFTDAYCPVSVCSPTRYALMTGNYPFRSWKKSGVMSNYEPSMIGKNQLTLPQMLQNAGYETTGFGKWHLGASFPTLDGKQPAGYGQFKAENNGENIDLSKPISDGPLSYGFEHWYGFSCSSECWVMEQNNIVAALQHEFYNINAAQNKENIEIIKADTYLSRITKKASAFITEHKKSEPFFLYFAPYVPHIPLAVSEEFIGTTKAGHYGDYVHELDTQIGVLLKTLELTGQKENTLVIFASDNGSQFEMTSMASDLSKVSNSPEDVVKKKLDNKNHYPNGELRGTKWTAYEGGVRTPFIARWPGKIPANAKASEIFALNDLMATFASILGKDLTVNDAVDSYNMLPVLMGKKEHIRKEVIIQSSNNIFGLRMRKWKYIASAKDKNSGGKDQLYDLSKDISEANNLINVETKKTEQMKNELNKLLKSERTVTFKKQ